MRQQNLGTRSSTTSSWERLDSAAFGIIYGAIMVLSILLARNDNQTDPLETSFVLFGSVLAITLAKAFAMFVSLALEAKERMTRQNWERAWVHSLPTLAVANIPTLLFFVAWLGWIKASEALLFAQILCVQLLVILGARAGWVLDGRIAPAVLGGFFVGGVGILLSLLKYLIH